MSTLTSPSTRLARIVDHTLLKPETTAADIAAHIDEAVELGAFSVCVSPSFLPLDIPTGADLAVAVVVGFPSGKHTTAVKTAEAIEAVGRGTDEIDMVIDIGAAKAGRFDLVEADIASVRGAIPAPRILKVIIESAALTDDEIVGACRAAVAAGADFVKTSTGFHPAGGATVHAVRLMKQTVGDAAEVKASGGIRSLADAQAMIDAGATRLGLSGTRAILAEAAGESPAPSTPDAY
ncbi:deoxyribose-phosphate aldolase [Labedella endophytica]|uniref:Deoxyribose-phosphate aldolase n=1 Tax=Labedella endophytica TaxID=1523160 RepID=A0A3S0VIE8_9MICO|nr:deoxyribose-phosphate aldolase [Labedella endophytica]RUR03257.1 deoxyribose-phosphate aldolase [Labedella endophytica]